MPIDVKELRIGNYIQHLKPIQIIGIKSRKILVGSFMSTSPERYHQQPISVEDWVDAVMCNPIELTPDILVKMGFKEVDKRFEKFGNITYEFRDIYFKLIKTILYPNPSSEIDTPLAYLHTLQNYIFAVFSQELIYTP